MGVIRSAGCVLLVLGMLLAGGSCFVKDMSQRRHEINEMRGYINRAAHRPAVVGTLRMDGDRRLHSTQHSDTDAPVVLETNPFAKEQIQCILCKHNISPDYKNVQLLSQFQSPYTGRVYGRHITGLCKSRHEQVEREIIKAQNAGLMPTYHKAVEFLNDPKLFDPEKAVRPHKY